jgi:hypothetical protein
MNDLRWLAEYVVAKQAGMNHTHAALRAECVCVNASTPQEKQDWVSAHFARLQTRTFNQQQSIRVDILEARAIGPSDSLDRISLDNRVKPFSALATD